MESVGEDGMMEFLEGLVGFLVPHLPWLLGLGQRAADKAAETVGAQGAQRIWNKLLPVVEAKPEVMAVAKDAAEKPGDGDTVAALRYQLKKILMAPENSGLAAELGTMWAEMEVRSQGQGVIQQVSGKQNQVIGIINGGSASYQGGNPRSTV